MYAALSSAIGFVEQYITPIIFAWGVIVLLYGIVVYYIVGLPSGDEEVIEKGRQHLLRSMVIFFVAVLAQGGVLFLLWLLSFFDPSAPRNIHDDGPRDSGFGADVRRDDSLLPTPNAPIGNPVEEEE